MKRLSSNKETPEESGNGLFSDSNSDSNTIIDRCTHQPKGSQQQLHPPSTSESERRSHAMTMHPGNLLAQDQNLTTTEDSSRISHAMTIHPGNFLGKNFDQNLTTSTEPETQIYQESLAVGSIVPSKHLLAMQESVRTGQNLHNSKILLPTESQISMNETSSQLSENIYQTMQKPGQMQAHLQQKEIIKKEVNFEQADRMRGISLEPANSAIGHQKMKNLTGDHGVYDSMSKFSNPHRAGFFEFGCWGNQKI